MDEVIRRHPRADPGLVDRYRGLSAATVSEAQGRRGAVAAAIKPIAAGMRLLGTALTVNCPPGDNLMLHRALELVGPGEVIVCDNQGWEGGPWGELMTVMAQAHSCAGLLIDGHVRDGAAIAAAGFPVFARGLALQGTTKERLGLVNHPVRCGGISVRPGDLVVGDDDGVCVVAREAVGAVLEAARAREEKEQSALREYAAGATLWREGGLSEVAVRLGMTEAAGSE